jgi:quercetin dioxygenase-like cupin family protein
MPKHRHSIAAAALLLALGAGCSTADRTAAQATPPAPQVEPVLKSGKTVLDQPVVYPEDAPAQVTAAIVTLPPGTSTGWHTHAVPLFGYMLEGELTVDYRGHGQRVYRPGDALMEAIGTAHNGHNDGDVPVRILAVYMGAEGIANAQKAE